MNQKNIISTEVVELIVRDDIWDIKQISLSKVVKRFIRCTSCLPQLLVNNPGYTHEVKPQSIGYGRCETCGAVTVNHACVTLGVIPQELEQLAATRQIHFVSVRNKGYRIIRKRPQV